MTKPEHDNAMLFRVAELFLEGHSASAIAQDVNRRLDAKSRITRESVYRLVRRATKRGMIELVPPIEDTLAEQLADRFGLDQRLHVVNVSSESSQYVAAKAARVVLDYMMELTPGRSAPIGLGLGSGRGTLDFVRHLTSAMAITAHAIRLNLFAISAGCPSRNPEVSSASFFNLFPDQLVNQRIGLFAETLVRYSEFEEIKTRPGVRDAFAERENVDIVVTSMGDFADEHGLFQAFLTEAGIDVQQLIDSGWVGDVQYRPYTSTGPVIGTADDFRAVTLFELSELAEMAMRKRKYVILIARQCGLCGRTRAAALKPLLEVPELRVFSDLVVDTATAHELLRA